MMITAMDQPPVTNKMRAHVSAIVALIDQLVDRDTTDEQRAELRAKIAERRRTAQREMKADQDELLQFANDDDDPEPPTPRRLVSIRRPRRPRIEAEDDYYVPIITKEDPW